MSMRPRLREYHRRPASHHRVDVAPLAIATSAGFGHPAPLCVTTTFLLGTPLGARRAASLPSRDGLDMAPQPLAGAARSQADLRCAPPLRPRPRVAVGPAERGHPDI